MLAPAIMRRQWRPALPAQRESVREVGADLHNRVPRIGNTLPVGTGAEQNSPQASMSLRRLSNKSPRLAFST
jgi:hypothetical protein